MSEKPDIEDILKRSRIEPREHVKRAVLARYAERFGREGSTGRALGLWSRPVPLYAAAALVIAAAGLSFAGGRALSQRGRGGESASLAAQDSLAGTELERSWSFAPRDLF